ncbi:uncharacterized protein METZ01_LOCUS44693 [marine metagenome]|uniref:Uncharacterized protein n=1 Tax=marine metagenome TaxID=408172 RepID=A0A381RLJ2_9ZZZZ
MVTVAPTRPDRQSRGRACAGRRYRSGYHA